MNDKILCIDDDQNILSSYKFQLQKQFHVEISRGREAFSTFESLKPDIVILDSLMPEMKGFDICSELRRMHGGKYLPILMITAVDDIKSLSKAYEVGATDFITKPFNWLILNQRLRYMLRASQTLHQLSKSKSSFAKAQRIAHLGSWEFDIEKNELSCSDETYRIYGLQQQKVENSFDEFLSFVHINERELVTRLINQAINYKKPFQTDHVITLKDGTKRFVSQNVEVISNGNDKAAKLIGTIQDITERKNIEDLEIDRNEIMEMIITNKPIHTILFHIIKLIERQKPHAICFVSLLHGKKLYIEAATKLPKPFIEYINGKMIGPKDGCCSAAAYFGDTTIVSDVSTSPLWENCQDIALSYNIKSSISIPIFSGKGQVLGTVSMFFQIPYEPNSTDIHILKVVSKLSAIAIEKHKLISQLIHHSRYDPLTKLPNRIFLKDHLMHGIYHALRYNKKIAILHINLDRFKYVNDSIGHQIGDLLLQQVAERIMNFTRESDILSHIGGDEFALLLNDTAKEAVTKVALRILQSLTASFELHDYEFHVSASIGISVFPDDGQDVETLQKNAAIAMYYSKNQGGNQFNYFSPEMNAETIERFEIENELRKAIEREEFQVYYQPQFDLRKVEIIGFEALLRWNHSELGFISPEKFIPIAEECGIIVPIGKWVLNEACRQNVEWQNKGYGYFKISINVSTAQLMEDDFLSVVEDALVKNGLPSQWLELEITESALMKDIKSIAERLTKLQKRGVSIAIDDFGTGYSSMAYLKSLPINCLKIDRSFMIDIGTSINSSHQAKALIQAFVSLAKNLGLKTVAEGLENHEQFKFLYEIGCDIGQGFFFKRPMAAQESIFLDKNWIF